MVRASERTRLLRFRAVAPVRQEFQNEFGKFPVVEAPVSEIKSTISQFKRRGFEFIGLVTSARSVTSRQQELQRQVKEGEITSQREVDVRQSEIDDATLRAGLDIRGGRDVQEPTEAEKDVKASLVKDIRQLPAAQARAEIQRRDVEARQAQARPSQPREPFQELETEEPDSDPTSSFADFKEDAFDKINTAIETTRGAIDERAAGRINDLDAPPPQSLDSSGFFENIGFGKDRPSFKERKESLFGEIKATGGGVKRQIVEQPRESAAIVGTSAALGAGLSLAAGTVAAPVLVPVGVVGGLGFLGFQAFKGKQRVSQATTREEKAALRGEITTEFALGGIGGTGGFRGGQRFSGLIRTRGRTFAPDLIPKKVISGETTFPTAPISKQKAIFEAGKVTLPSEPKGTVGVFHAAPTPLKSSVVQSQALRPSDVSGLYTAPFISANFFRTGFESPIGIGTSIRGGRPTALRIIPTRISEAPRGTTAQTKTFFETKAPKGEAIIPRLKSEIEAVIPVETKLVKTGKGQFFTKFKGRRIPIEEFKTIGEPLKTPTPLKVPPLRTPKPISVKQFQRVARRSSISRGRNLINVETIASRISRPSRPSSIIRPTSSIISSPTRTPSSIIRGSSRTSSIITPPSRIISAVSSPRRVSSSIIAGSSRTPPTIVPPSSPVAPPFKAVFKFGLPKLQRTKIKKPTRSRFQFTPSVIASQFGLRGKVKLKGIQSGLNIRFIPINIGKKRKKKKR